MNGQMENQPTVRGPKRFSEAKDAFSRLDPSTVSNITSSGADITLLLSHDGKIVDVAYLDASLEQFRLEAWKGKAFSAIVTSECIDKVSLMLEEASKVGYSRTHQVNHSGPDKLDLPTEFVVVRFEGFDYLVAFGRDLRRFSKIQQQLINAQFELEREYRRIRENEARFRLVFQKFPEAVVVVDGENLSIIDANNAFATMFSASLSSLSGASIVSRFAKPERAALTELLKAAALQGQSERCVVSDAADTQVLDVHIEPFRESGRVNLVLTLASRAEQAGEDGSHALSYRWIDNIPEPMVVIDNASVVVDLNDRFLDLVRVLNRNQIVGRAIGTWVGASNVDMQVLTTRLRTEGEVQQFLTTVRDDAGNLRSVRISAVRALHGDGELAYLIFNEQPVRETRVTVTSAGARSEAADFAELIGRVPLKTLVREAGDVIEKLCIEAALRQTNDNKASAADLLGLSRQSLYMKLKTHGLD